MQYGHDCAQKDQIVLITKMDCFDQPQQAECVASVRQAIQGHPELCKQVKAVVGVLAQQGFGIDELKNQLVAQLADKWD